MVGSTSSRSSARDPVDVLEDARELARHPLDLLLGELEPGEARDVQDLLAIDHGPDSRSRLRLDAALARRAALAPPVTRMPPAMTGQAAERFVVVSLRLLAVTFAVVGLLFIAAPDGIARRLSTTSATLPLGPFTPAPETTEQLWLALGFAYMTVITLICVVVSTDVVRYRPLLLVLAAGKAASSLTALGFYLSTRRLRLPPQLPRRRLPRRRRALALGADGPGRRSGRRP